MKFGNRHGNISFIRHLLKADVKMVAVTIKFHIYVMRVSVFPITYKLHVGIQSVHLELYLISHDFSAWSLVTPVPRM